MAIDRSNPIPIIPSATEIPFLLLPETENLFFDRAARLKSLATGHAMADYLGFVAEIALAQQQALNSLHPSLPEGTGGPVPLDHTRLHRDPVWQQVLRQIIAAVTPKAPPDYARWMNGLLEKATPGDLEQWAQGMLEGDPQHCDIGMMPMVAAALQVYWTALTRHLEANSIRHHPDGHAAQQCPVCNAPPVGSLVRSGATTQGLRYLACSLCNAQWHMERIHCVNCGESAKVFYYGIEGGDDTVQAESCDACHTYSKVMHMEKNPAADVIADDLATLPLDVLVGEAGFERYGPNPFLMTETGHAARD